MGNISLCTCNNKSIKTSKPLIDNYYSYYIDNERSSDYRWIVLIDNQNRFYPEATS